MKKLSLIIIVVSFLIITGLPVHAKDFSFVRQEGTVLASGAWESSEISAESFLSTLAKEKEIGRKIGGTITTGIGLIFLGWGISEDNGAYIPGGIITTVGVCILGIPSYVESEYDRVLQIEDEYKREQASYAALVNVANQARVSRLSTGAFSAALCLYWLTKDDDDTTPPSSYSDDNGTNQALLYGALCAYSFLVESTPEKMLNEYKENQSSARGNSAFTLMPDLNGSISVVYSYRF